MIPLIAGLAGLALVLFASGLPPLKRTRMSARVEPYLSGLRGRPSALLVRSTTRAGARLAQGKASALLRLVSSHDSSRYGRLEERLAAGGSDGGAAEFRLEQIAWGTGAMLAGWACIGTLSLTTVDLDARSLPLLSALFFAGGFLGRDYRLGRQIERRRVTIEEELPTAIDLLTLSILSGESVGGAFARVGEALGSGIGGELRKVVADVRAGSPLLEALEDMKVRIPVPGSARLIDALTTGIERGTPLADVLRAQSEDGRETKRRALMEVGGRREVLMLVPVVFLIMPVVVVFVLYPSLVSLDLLVP